MPHVWVNGRLVLAVFSSSSSTAASGLITLFLCLLASLACEPDVYRMLLPLTILYKLRRLCGKKLLSRLSYCSVIRHCKSQF